MGAPGGQRRRRQSPGGGPPGPVPAVRPETEALPKSENQPGYRKSYELYKRVYPALKPVYDLGAQMGY